MEREAGFVVVGALVLVALVVLAVYLVWSRARLLSLERFVRVLVGIVDLEQKRAATKRAADLQRLAAVEQAQARLVAEVQAHATAPAQARGVTEPEDDEEHTHVWTGPPAALVEAAARGAHLPRGPRRNPATTTARRQMRSRPIRRCTPRAWSSPRRRARRSRIPT
jgi:hypothetical protein